MAGYQCIYCMELKPSSSFKSAEHVLSQCFGMFSNNLTLHGDACDDCNQFFGKKLETSLARDTLEGISRVDHGLQAAAKFKTAGKASRILTQIEEGEAKGAYAYRQYSETYGKVLLFPLPQIGFRVKNTGEYRYFLVDQLPEKEFFTSKDLDSQHPRFYHSIAVSEETVATRLAERGLPYKHHGATSNITGPVECKVEFTVDDIILRAIAKMGFNYFTKMRGADIARCPEFDGIRRYIRYGDDPGYLPVRMLARPILGDEPEVGLRRLGHILTIDVGSEEGSIVSQVSLMNLMTYEVSLTKSYNGDRFGLLSGHFFNLADLSIIPLGKIHGS